MKKRVLAIILVAVLCMSLFAGCGGGSSTSSGGGSSAPAASGGSSAPAASGGSAAPAEPAKELTRVQAIIKEAEGMTMEELAKKAIEESNGKTLYGVGNSSRGKSALPKFITFALTLIQDGNQIESKMVQTGVLDTFIPKEWAEAKGVDAATYDGYLPLQTLNKVFMYNNTGSFKPTNVWDYVGEGQHGQFMDIDSEIVGKNFLYMLTAPQYAAWLKESFDKLPDAQKAYFKPTIDEVAQDAKDLDLDANGAYALAWIKLWVGSYNAVTDDGPICNNLVQKSATDQFGLLVYSKLRSVEESAEVSVNNVNVAAYDDGYEGIGGFGYCHYMFVTDNSPLPWTACAFIAYITCTVDGFSAWGKDMGGYSSNPEVAKGVEETYHHSTGGGTEFPNKNDRGYDWWTTDGKLVLEDPAYCAGVAFTVGSWIEILDKYAG